MGILKYVAGLLYSNDKLVSVVGETAENGGIESGSNANGNYVKYPDGTLIQYGSSIGSTSALGITETLPITFLNTGYRIIANGSSSTSSSILFPKINSKTTTTFNILSYAKGDSVSTHALATYDIDWIAIGRWK